MTDVSDTKNLSLKDALLALDKVNNLYDLQKLIAQTLAESASPDILLYSGFGPNSDIVQNIALSKNASFFENTVRAQFLKNDNLIGKIGQLCGINMSIKDASQFVNNPNFAPIEFRPRAQLAKEFLYGRADEGSTSQKPSETTSVRHQHATATNFLSFIKKIFIKLTKS